MTKNTDLNDRESAITKDVPDSNELKIDPQLSLFSDEARKTPTLMQTLKEKQED